MGNRNGQWTDERVVPYMASGKLDSGVGDWVMRSSDWRAISMM